MNRKKSKNTIDSVLDAVVLELINADKAHNILDSPKGMRLIESFSRSLIEIIWVKEAFVKEYIPRATKAYVNSRNEWKTSRYRTKFQFDDSFFREAINETIRLGYIGLFHKYESFIKNSVQETELYFSNIWESNISLDDFAKNEFGIKVFWNWKISRSVDRLNWISNSCKHNNGFPKTPKHDDFKNWPDDQKLIISKDAFKADCTSLEKHCNNMLQLLVHISSFRTYCESKNDDSSFVENRTKMKELISSYLELLKLV